MSKKFLVVLLVLVAAAGFVYARGEAEKAAPKAQTLRVQWWGSQTRNDQTIAVGKLFTAKYPNVTIEPEFLGWSGYFEKVATQAAGGDMADVVQMNLAKGWGLQFLEKGLLTDMTPYVKKGALKIDDIAPAALQAFQLKGGLYAIPLGTSAATFVYNEEMFQKAGVALPTRDWTWKDFQAAALKLHKELGVFGFGEIVGYDIFPIYLRQQGATFFAADGKGLGYSNDAYFADFFRMKLELQKEKAMPTPTEIKQLSGLEDKYIVRKQAAMDFVYSNQSPTVSTASKTVVFKNAFIPGPNVQKGMSLLITMEFTIPSQGKKQDMAANFIDFFVNDVAANKVMMGERGVPVSSKIRDALLTDLQPAQKEMFRFITDVSGYCSAGDPLPPTKSTEVIQILKDVEEEILFGVVTPEAGAAKFRKLAEAVLKS